MRTMSVVGVLLCSLLYGIADVSASLLNLSNTKGDLICDTISQDLWIQNLMIFNALSYEAKITKINDLNRPSYFGTSSWRLPPSTTMQQLGTNPAREHFKFKSGHLITSTRYFEAAYDAQPAPGVRHHNAATAQDLCQPPSDAEEAPSDCCYPVRRMHLGERSLGRALR